MGRNIGDKEKSGAFPGAEIWGLERALKMGEVIAHIMIKWRWDINESQERGEYCGSEFLEYERVGANAQMERLSFAGSTEISSKRTGRKTGIYLC